MADFSVVPIVDVQNDNFKEVWPTLMLGLKTATFVALDLELSGLGDRGKLFARAIEDRYNGMCDVAKTRSVLSFGLSCFKLTDTQAKSTNLSQTSTQDESQSDKGCGVHFVVQTYNIMLLCSDNYMVEPLSLRFLINHGFDFNKQYATGISYYRGNDKEQKESVTMRHLFAEIVRQEVPIVLHNGIIDLVFMYQNFYAELPPNMPTFMADMSEMFPAGVFDTKYITEFQARFPASFLQYVFRKCQRENYASSVGGGRHVEISSLNYPSSYPHVSNNHCAIKDSSQHKHINVCDNYGNHGWCSHGNSCPLSHDVDLVLDNENHVSEKKKRKRSRKKKKKDVDESMDTEDTPNSSTSDLGQGLEQLDMDPDDSTPVNSSKDDQEMTPEAETPSGDQNNVVENGQNVSGNVEGHKKSGGHRAGFDAFMTGFIFSHYIVKYGAYKDLTSKSKLQDLCVEEFTNKLCLGGKDIPLQVMKSGFSKTSKDHKQKLLKIKGSS